MEGKAFWIDWRIKRWKRRTVHESSDFRGTGREAMLTRASAVTGGRNKTTRCWGSGERAFQTRGGVLDSEVTPFVGAAERGLGHVCHGNCGQLV